MAKKFKCLSNPGHTLLLGNTYIWHECEMCGVLMLSSRDADVHRYLSDVFQSELKAAHHEYLQSLLTLDSEMPACVFLTSYLGCLTDAVATLWFVCQTDFTEADRQMSELVSPDPLRRIYALKSLGDIEGIPSVYRKSLQILHSNADTIYGKNPFEETGRSVLSMFEKYLEEPTYLLYAEHQAYLFRLLTYVMAKSGFFKFINSFDAHNSFVARLNSDPQLKGLDFKAVTFKNGQFLMNPLHRLQINRFGIVFRQVSMQFERKVHRIGKGKTIGSPMSSLEQMRIVFQSVDFTPVDDEVLSFISLAYIERRSLYIELKELENKFGDPIELNRHLARLVKESKLIIRLQNSSVELRLMSEYILNRVMLYEFSKGIYEVEKMILLSQCNPILYPSVNEILTSRIYKGENAVLDYVLRNAVFVPHPVLHAILTDQLNRADLMLFRDKLSELNDPYVFFQLGRAFQEIDDPVRKKMISLVVMPMLLLSDKCPKSIFKRGKEFKTEPSDLDLVQPKIDVARTLVFKRFNFQNEEDSNDYLKALLVNYGDYILLSEEEGSSYFYSKFIIHVSNCYFKVGSYEVSVTLLRNLLDYILNSGLSFDFEWVMTLESKIRHFIKKSDGLVWPSFSEQ